MVINHGFAWGCRPAPGAPTPDRCRTALWAPGRDVFARRRHVCSSRNTSLQNIHYTKMLKKYGVTNRSYHFKPIEHRPFHKLLLLWIMLRLRIVSESSIILCLYVHFHPLRFMFPLVGVIFFVPHLICIQFPRKKNEQVYLSGQIELDVSGWERSAQLLVFFFGRTMRVWRRTVLAGCARGTGGCGPGGSC